MFITNGKPKVPGVDKEYKRKKITVPFEFSATKEVTASSSEGMDKEEGSKRKVKQFYFRAAWLVSI